VFAEAEFAIVHLGINGVGALATMQTNFLAILASARTLLGADTPIYGCTLMPRNLPHGTVAVAAAAGATSIVLHESDVPSGSARIGEGPTLETATLSASPTGTGPFTYGVTALASAHKAGETVARGGEVDRLAFNAWLRGLPAGIAAVVDHELALAAPWDRSLLRPEFAQSDQLHPTAAGLNRMAEVVPVRF
jgi:hypothetical protein